MSVSPYIVAPLLGWMIAQAIKFVIDGHTVDKSDHWIHMYRAGGMPSTHSAMVAALVTVVGFKEGVDSALFGVSLLFAAIVIYDAMNVRYSVGQQGEMLKKLVANNKTLHKESESLYVVHGHTLAETLAGASVGFLVGLAVYSLIH